MEQLPAVTPVRPRASHMEQRIRRVGEIKGRFVSGCPDLAEAHDRYLDEAFDC